MDKKIDDSLGKIKNLLNSIMELEWFIGFLLLITCLDLYFTLKYGVSVITAANQWQVYFTRVGDYIYFILIFSLIFTMIFPALKGFHIFILSSILDKIGINCYEGSYNDYNRHSYTDYKWITFLKLNAAKENNEVLLKYLIKKEDSIHKRSRESAKFLAVNLFLLIQYLFAKNIDSYPVIVKIFLHGYDFAEQQGFFLQKIFELGLVIFACMWLVLFLRAFIIPSYEIYFPDEKKKNAG